MNPTEDLVDEAMSSISDEDLRQLDVLGDIQVVLRAELGRVTMPLSAVLDMLPGTVFELGQIVTAPIDLMIDGHVVGHGNVVAVDDHFGVRVVGLGAQPPPARLSSAASP